MKNTASMMPPAFQSTPFAAGPAPPDPNGNGNISEAGLFWQQVYAGVERSAKLQVGRYKAA